MTGAELWLGIALLVGFVALDIAFWALIKAYRISYGYDTVDSEVDAVHRRLNGWKIDDLKARLKGAEAELFRKGDYPNLGLREWCRVWRRKLRLDILSLHWGLDIQERQVSDLRDKLAYEIQLRELATRATDRLGERLRLTQVALGVEEVVTPMKITQATIEPERIEVRVREGQV